MSVENDFRAPAKGPLQNLPPRVRERILAVLLGHRHRLKVETLEHYSQVLCLLALEGDLDDVRVMEEIIAGLSSGRLNVAIPAYRHYCRWWRLPEPEIRARRDRRRPLPKVPMEETLKASLVTPRSLKWRAYLRLLYETGARASEPFYLRVKDLDGLDREILRIGTSKYGGEVAQRELPISPLLTAQLRLLIKDRDPGDFVFRQTHDPHRPLCYHRVERMIRQVRAQLRSAGRNVQGLRLHGYRHAFATRLYHATKDLALVSRSLGHRNLETTMIYVHLRPDQPRRYDVIHVALGDKEKVTQQIAEGWEIALQTADRVWFRRPRWVP